MKVILKQDVESLGKLGDIVDVKPGYARNYLIPKGMGMAATDQNIRRLQMEQQQSQLKMTKDRKNAEKLAEKLNEVSCTAAVTVGEEDKVFGSVTTQIIADLLKEKGFDIDRKKIVLDEPIKALGIYTIPIRLHTDVEAKIKLWVVKE
ncbi:MAG: 50S ribosomal protein L9 [candidate division KSB1 bacterium]|nr:50S ribosomal protein L9 [candidate division KSB1 bacterium]MDZ7318380.1 50S ribosomal protein L9 [candidate division KSB1 bacterium]MDZ7341007.1 50S ribosomal protein L9 [candidate division KSB1 bacterium]